MWSQFLIDSLYWFLSCFLFIIFQVVVVDLEYNRITTSEEIPPIPEPELSSLRDEITKLLHPNVVGIDLMKADFGISYELYSKGGNKPWGEDHDLQLRWNLVLDAVALNNCPSQCIFLREHILYGLMGSLCCCFLEHFYVFWYIIWTYISLDVLEDSVYHSKTIFPWRCLLFSLITKDILVA